MFLIRNVKRVKFVSYLILIMRQEFLSIYRFCTFFVILIIASCNPCEFEDPAFDDSKDLFFSAMALNSDQPSIYAITQDGSFQREIVRNGILFSPPSRNGKIVYLGIDKLEKVILIVSDTKGEKQDTIPIDVSYDTLNSPAISPDGEMIAVYAGNGKLFLIKGSLVLTASTNFCEKTLASFSTFGNYLAFYEGSDLEGPLIIKVVRTDDPNQIVFEKSFTSGLQNVFGEALVSWSNDEELICYKITNESNVDEVHIVNINGGGQILLEMTETGADLPTLSPNKQSIAYTANNGEIWIRQTGGVAFFPVDTSGGVCINPRWTKDGKKIFYTKLIGSDIEQKFSGMLMIADIEEMKKTTLISNVYKVYQNYK